MVDDVQVDEFYDFLYRDANRLASYYAQIFSGRLASIEHTDSDKSGKERTGKVNAQVAGADFKSSAETQNTEKRTIDPHDMIASDVLTYLREHGFIHSDAAEAPSGSIIIAQGTLALIDSTIAELAGTAFDNLLAAELTKPIKQRDNLGIQNMKMIKNFMSKISFPSAFVLQSEAGLQTVGTLKEVGLEETISSSYFKHGGSGLADIFVVGIKEVGARDFTFALTDFMAAGLSLAEQLNILLFPPNSIRITPLAMFRRLSLQGSLIPAS